MKTTKTYRWGLAAAAVVALAALPGCELLVQFDRNKIDSGSPNDATTTSIDSPPEVDTSTGEDAGEDAVSEATTESPDAGVDAAEESDATAEADAPGDTSSEQSAEAAPEASVDAADGGVDAAD